MAKAKKKIGSSVLAQLAQAESQIEREKNYDTDLFIDKNLIYSLVDDKEIAEILIDRSSKIFNVQVKNSLFLGEVLTEVFDLLSKSGSKYEGLYEKWLQVNGFSRRTALRYRKRFELYSEVSSVAKDTVAVLPQGYVEYISQEENKEMYINILNEGVGAKEIINRIKNQDIIEDKRDKKKIVLSEINDFKNYKNLLVDLDERVETLNEKKRKELQKYLKRIEEILK